MKARVFINELIDAPDITFREHCHYIQILQDTLKEMEENEEYESCHILKICIDYYIDLLRKKY